jgi:hypothetical protein
MRPRKAIAVTHEQVLEACRAYFAHRWGRPFGPVERIQLEIVPPLWLRRPFVPVEQVPREIARLRREHEAGHRRYRALYKAYRDAAKHVQAVDPQRGTRHDTVLQVFLPQLAPIMERMARALATTHPAERRDSWSAWIDMLPPELVLDRMSAKDWAVLRLLGGHWAELTDIAREGFRKPADAIAAVAKLAREAERHKNKRTTE